MTETLAWGILATICVVWVAKSFYTDVIRRMPWRR